jgi:hypothetical protein
MQELATDIWRVAGADLRLPGGVYMPLVATVIRLPDRSLLVYSPIAFTPEQHAAIDAAGEVAHVMAPSLLHHLFVAEAMTRWPRATLHAAPGLAAKLKLPAHRTLGAGADPTWQDALDSELIAGAPRIAETVVFHRASGTLVCADLVFNITAPANLRTRAVLAMMGIGGRKLAQSRVWRFAVRDRAATRASLDRVLAWPIARVAPTHGDAMPLDANELAARLVRSYHGRPARLLTAASV